MGLIAIPSADSLQANLALKVLLDTLLTIRDYSNNNLAAIKYGNVECRPLTSLFDPSIYYGSFYFNGADSGLGFSSATAFSFGAQDFCVEAYVKADAGSGGFRCIASTIRDMGNAVAGGGALIAGIGGWGNGDLEANVRAETIPGGSGTFGQGGDGAYCLYTSGGGGGGGGGGYYGGGGGAGGGGAGGGGGGGSNFIASSFSSTVSKNGSENILLPDGTNSIGNKGNGFVRITRTSDSQVTNFSYTGAAQTFTVPSDDTYLIEVWGAQGGEATVNGITEGGRGGYCEGIITLSAGTVLNIYVGGQNGYNGGGAGGMGYVENGKVGGGASDVRLSGTALSDRIIVAGGGGGCGGAGSQLANNGYKTSGVGGAAGENGITGGSRPNGWALFIDETARCFWACINYSDGSYDIIRENADPLNASTWNHVALVRSGGAIALYRNGIKTGEVACGTKSVMTNTAGFCYLGCFRDDEGGRIDGLQASLKGCLNDVRITIGHPRYTANFTPPSAFGYTTYAAFGSSYNVTYTKFADAKFIYQVPFAQNFQLIRPSETMNSPKSVGIRVGGPKSTGGSQEYAGFGKIYGVVTEQANPISCLLRLYDSTSGALVAATHSAQDGKYMFDNLKMTTTYTLVAYNPSKNYNSIIRDLIIPERM